MREHNRRPMRPFLVTEYAKGGTPALTPGAFILNRSVSAEHIPSVSNLNGKSLKTPTAKVAAQMDMDKPGREEATCKTQHSPDDNPGPSHSTSEVLAGTEVCDGQDVADLSAGVPLSDGEGGDYLVKATTLAQTAPASPFSSTYDRPDASKRARSTPKRRKSKELEDIKCNSRRWDVPIRGRMCYIAQARPSTVIPMVVTSYRNQIRCVDGFYVTTRYTDTTRALTNPPCDACGVLARKSKCLFDNCGDCCRDVNNNPCKVHRTKADAMFLQLKADVRRQKLRKQHGMCLMYQAGQCRKGSACYYDHGEGPEMLDIDSEIGTPLRITLCVRDYANESERSTRNDKMSLPQSVLMTALAKEISSPFTFQINQRGSNVMTHGGVWEFTAPENTVLLTPLMQARLGVRSGDMVELKSVSLPSGTFAKFKALDMLSWQRIPTAMVRSLLEFELRKHQTLGVGSVVDVVFADKKCELEVMECKPSNAISLIDSELAFDIDVSDMPTTLDMSVGSTADTRTVLIPGHRTHGVLPAVGPVSLVVQTEALTRPSVLTFKLSCTGTPTAPDTLNQHASQAGQYSIYPRLLLSQSEPQPSITSHTWWGAGEGSCTRSPTVVLCTACDPDYHHALTHIYASASASTLVDGKRHPPAAAVDVRGEEGTGISGVDNSGTGPGHDSVKYQGTTYEFSTEVSPAVCGGDATQCPVGQQRLSPDSKLATPTQTPAVANSVVNDEACRNCGLTMPITRLVSHERHCKNNTYSCPTCDVKLPLDSREWHEVFMHTRTTCVCSAELTHHALLNAHVRMECSKRMIQCSNLGCLLLTPAYRHTEHLRECGSVTIACPICIENVCRSAAVFHFEAMHGIQAEQLRSGVPLEDQVAALIAAGKVYDF